MMAATTALGFALATTHWVIDWVHDHATNGWANSAPTAAASLARRFVHVLHVTDLANRGVAGFVNLPEFSGRHFDESVTSLAVIQDDQLASAAGDLTATSGNQFHIVNRSTKRNGFERKR